MSKTLSVFIRVHPWLNCFFRTFLRSRFSAGANWQALVSEYVHGFPVQTAGVGIDDLRVLCFAKCDGCLASKHEMVDDGGIEPPTSALRTQRSPN